MTTLFRGLIVASVLLSTALYWLPAYDAALHSIDAERLLNDDGLEAKFHLGMFWGTLFFTAEISALALTYFFYRAGRLGLVLLWMLYPLANLWLGYRVLTPVEALGTWWLGLLDGAILAMAYVTPLSQRFGTPPSRPTTSTAT